jgi:uncharacterized protein YnzC (UPF0291/DUF896 family)
MKCIYLKTKKVIDMVTYSQPKMDELRQKYIENVRNDVQQATIEKLQQQIDAEAAGLNNI